MNLYKGYSSSSSFLHASFNQDYGCFAVGLNNGFAVYNTSPLVQKVSRVFNDGGIGIIAMLYRSNLLALVGGGRNPKFPPNKVVIWDDLKNKFIFALEFRSEVFNVKLRKHIIVVVLRNRVVVNSFSIDSQKLHLFETLENDEGLIGMSTEGPNTYIAVPGRRLGQIQIIELAPQSTDVPNETYSPTTSVISAHTSHLSCISMTQDGSRIATSSDKGTLIRIFDTKKGTLINELRRGVDRAVIYSIAFNADASRLCVASDKGTIHVFNVNRQEGEDMTGGDSLDSPRSPISSSVNRQSSLSFMKDLLPKYFSSEWSFAQCKIPAETRCLVGWNDATGNAEDRGTFFAICADGSICVFSFDQKLGGECQRDRYDKFIDS